MRLSTPAEWERFGPVNVITFVATCQPGKNPGDIGGVFGAVSKTINATHLAV